MSVLANLIARNHRLLAAGITPVGFYINEGTTSGGATTTTITLHTDAQAGDVALITINTSSANPGLSVTSPVMTEALAPYNYASSGGAYEYIAAYLYTLTADDITAGSLAVTTSEVATELCVMGVFRGVSMTPGVVGSVGKGVAPEFVVTDMPAPGITTLVDGSVVVYFAAMQRGGAVINRRPADFTDDIPGTYSQILFHRPPAPASATGDVTVAVWYGSNTNDWAAVLISLNPVGEPTPFALSGTFGSATVGVEWTGVLTFDGNYTGPVVMDVAAGTLPDWITPPVVDENAKTATYTGTPATGDIGTDTFTPRATPATGTAATSEQSFAVSAASSGAPTIVQVTPGLDTSTPQYATAFKLDNAPTVGNWLMVVQHVNSNASTRTLSALDASWIEWPKGQIDGAYMVDIFLHKIVDGDGTDWSFPISGPHQRGGGALFEITGTDGTILGSDGVEGARFDGPYSATAAADDGDALAIGFIGLTTASGGPATANSGWDSAAVYDLPYSHVWYYSRTTSADKPTTMTAGATSGAGRTIASILTLKAG